MSHLIVISRCHDEDDQGARTEAGLSEWYLTDIINQEIERVLSINKLQVIYLNRGKLKQRIAAINYADKTVDVSAAIEVHCNYVNKTCPECNDRGWVEASGEIRTCEKCKRKKEPDPRRAGFFVMAWHNSDKSIGMAEAITKRMKEEVSLPCMGLCRTSHSKRWIGDSKEYGDAKPVAFLEDTHCPAVLIECCHLSHPGEAFWITNVINRHALGRAIGDGIIDYFKEA